MPRKGPKEWRPDVPGGRRPVVLLVDDMEKLPGGRMYAATLYAWPFPGKGVEAEGLWESFEGRKDELNVDRTEQSSTPAAALEEGFRLAERKRLDVVYSATLY